MYEHIASMSAFPPSVNGDSSSFISESSVTSLPTRAAPNVLVLTVEEIGYQDWSNNLASKKTTPTFDELVQQSISFESFYGSPTSNPSRNALMTGKYSTTNNHPLSQVGILTYTTI